MTTSNALPTQNFSYRRCSNGYANTLPTGFFRFPTVCVPTPHTPRSVGRLRAETSTAPSTPLRLRLRGDESRLALCECKQGQNLSIALSRSFRRPYRKFVGSLTTLSSAHCCSYSRLCLDCRLLLTDARGTPFTGKGSGRFRRPHSRFTGLEKTGGGVVVTPEIGARPIGDHPSPHTSAIQNSNHEATYARS